MAGKTKDMSQIKQMLLLKKQGVSNRKIAKAIGINKETVNNYISKAVSDELGIEGLLKLDDPILERRLKGGNAAYTDERFAKFKELLPYLQEELKRKHVTLKLLWEEYIRENPEGYSLTQFRYHYRQNAVATKQPPSTVLRDTYVGGEQFAGEEAIWNNGKAKYAMNYLGRVLEKEFSGNFLKEALRAADRKMPYRGPEYYQSGEYTYKCSVNGDFTWFQGYEEIYWHDQKVYECFFHGGITKG